VLHKNLFDGQQCSNSILIASVFFSSFFSWQSKKSHMEKGIDGSSWIEKKEKKKKKKK